MRIGCAMKGCHCERFADPDRIEGPIDEDNPLFPAIVKELSVALAGPMAQAKVSKISLSKAFKYGGMGDCIAAMRLFNLLPEHLHPVAYNQADEAIRSALKSRWWIIERIAGRLLREGSVDGAVIDELLCEQSEKVREMMALLEKLHELVKQAGPDFWRD